MKNRGRMRERDTEKNGHDLGEPRYSKPHNDQKAPRLPLTLNTFYAPGVTIQPLHIWSESVKRRLEAEQQSPES